VLVTGATGFLGGRVVEKLFRERRATVRALVRDLPRAVRIARFPVELAHGDVSDQAAVQDAAAGCDVIVHCAYGTSGDRDERQRVNVEGTRNVLAAALSAGVQRVVHISTVMVYGIDTPATLDEGAPRAYCGDAYADSKLDAEEVAFQFHADHGVPVTVLQPTAIYGPFGVQWTERVFEQLQSKRVPLIDGGEGILNIVYIDDAADAVLLAAEIPEAVGEAFLVSGEGVTYKTFYGELERILGTTATVSLSEEEALTLWERSRTGEGLDDKSILLLDPTWIRYRSRRSLVSTEKARRILGFAPQFDLHAGMRLTEAWARWAGVVPA
jgi:nucleoside-diphosphate-sugar epimerase